MNIEQLEKRIQQIDNEMGTKYARMDTIRIENKTLKAELLELGLSEAEAREIINPGYSWDEKPPENPPLDTSHYREHADESFVPVKISDEPKREEAEEAMAQKKQDEKEKSKTEKKITKLENELENLEKKRKRTEEEEGRITDLWNEITELKKSQEDLLSENPDAESGMPEFLRKTIAIEDKEENKPEENTLVNPAKEAREILDVDHARGEYFKVLKFGKDEEAAKLRETYMNAKRERTRSIIKSEGLEAAQAFLTAEVAKEREKKLENGLIGVTETAVFMISNGIDRWNNLGNEGGWEGQAKKFGKMAVNLALIGVTSSLLAEKFADYMGKTVAAFSNTPVSFLAKKVGWGLGLGSISQAIDAKVPDKWKNVARTALGIGSASLGVVGVAAGGWIPSIAVGGATVAGYMTSKLIKKSSKKIESRKNALSLENLEAGLDDLEREINDILKSEEKRRIGTAILKGLTAVGVSSIILGASSMTSGWGDNVEQTEANNDTRAIPENKTPDEIENLGPPLPDDYVAPESTNPDFENAGPPLPEDYVAPESTNPDFENAGPPLPEDYVAPEPVNPDAIVGKGEGVEHALTRQIVAKIGAVETTEQLDFVREHFGFMDNPQDPEAVKEFAQAEAHRIAIRNGYVGVGGDEVRVAVADKIAYEIKYEDGKVFVEERGVDGQYYETHGPGDGFEMSGDKPHDPYEYNERNRVEVKADSEAAPVEPVPVEQELTQKQMEKIDPLPPEEIPVNLSKYYNEVPVENTTEILTEDEKERTEFRDTSKTEKVDTSKGGSTENAEEISSEQTESREELSSNPYGLDDETIEALNKKYDETIDMILPNNRDADYLMKVTAADTANENLDMISEEGRPLVTLIKELERVSEISPRGTTMLQIGETHNEYFSRVLQIEASRGDTLDITLDKNGFTHIEKNKL